MFCDLADTIGGYIKKILKGIAKNPLTIGSFAGVLMNIK